MSDDERKKRTELWNIASQLMGEIAYEDMCERAELDQLYALCEAEEDADTKASRLNNVSG